MTMEMIYLIFFVIACLGFVVILLLQAKLKSQKVTDVRAGQIASYIRKGAMRFLIEEYKDKR